MESDKLKDAIVLGSIEFKTLSTQDGVKISDAIRVAASAKNFPLRKIAQKMGWSPQNLNNRLKKNSFTAEELLEIADILEFKVQMNEVNIGVEFEDRIKGIGVRVRKIIDGVIYDTYRADALCSNFFQDGKNKYTDGMAFELYVDSFGRFFVARYVEWENGTNSITTVGKEEAGKLYRKFGDGTLPEAMFI